MNRRLFFALALAPIATAAFAKESKKERVVFSVDLHCDDCVKKIMKNIAFEKGVIDLKPDLNKKEVMVVYNNQKTDLNKLIAAFKKIGYDVKLLSSESI